MKIKDLESKVLTFFYVICFSSFFGLIILIGVYYYNGHINFKDIQTDKIGTFGDFVGGFLGTLFTIAATLLIWLTYVTQKNEFRTVNDGLKKQQFESTFFNLIDLHNRNIDGMRIIRVSKDKEDLLKAQIHLRNRTLGGSIKEYRDTLTGRECLEYLYSFFENHVYQSMESIKETDYYHKEYNFWNLIHSSYPIFFDKHRALISHYFQTLSHIINFIDSSSSVNSDDDKLEYAFILKAQLSYFEKLHLYYFSKSESNFFNKQLLEKFEILKDLDDSRLIAVKVDLL